MELCLPEEVEGIRGWKGNCYWHLTPSQGQLVAKHRAGGRKGPNKGSERVAPPSTSHGHDVAANSGPAPQGCLPPASHRHLSGYIKRHCHS